nr:hypothetical protein [uncultured Blautia sp.]
MAERKIRNLNPEEIECRVGTVMEQGITLLLYKNARVDQTILDEVFGICGWQRRHNMIGSELYCILSIWDDEKQQWVEKEDVGTESDYEKAKGAASDSFKRACFNIGIGRELYSAPFIYIPINKVQVGDKNGKKYVKDRFSVKNIHTTADKTITDLEIVNQRGETVYTYRTASTSRQSIETDQKEEQTEMISDQDIQNLYAELGRTGVTVQKIICNGAGYTIKKRFTTVFGYYDRMRAIKIRKDTLMSNEGLLLEDCYEYKPSDDEF